MSDPHEEPRDDEEREERDDAREPGDEPGADANELDADNEVEADTLETLDPEQPPA